MEKRRQGSSELHVQEKWRVTSRNDRVCQLSAEKLRCQRLPRGNEARGQLTQVNSQITEEIMQIESAKDLDVYKLANEFAMEVFEITKSFPPEEKYALTSQIRRSSRSVCLNLREAWAKRSYAAHFVSKLTDCDGENSETDSSLNFANQFVYISAEQHHALTGKCAEIGRMLGRHDQKVGIVPCSGIEI